MRKIAIIGAGEQLSAAKAAIEKMYAGTVEVVPIEELNESKRVPIKEIPIPPMPVVKFQNYPETRRERREKERKNRKRK